MSISNFLAKMGMSAARSLLLSEVKGVAKNFINNKKAKTAADIEKEITDRLGFMTDHYSINKTTQEITFKSSIIFAHKWLTSSPLVKEHLIRDEESGHIYVNEDQITDAIKISLIDRYVSSTGCKQAGITSHIDNALKLLDLQDINAIKFKKHFSGWKEGNPSIIDTWIEKCFGSILETDKAYANLLFKKWIIGSAKRAIEPGFSFDGCLVLASTFGGIGKTLHFRNLLPEPFNGRTGEIICNLKAPAKFVESIKGKTIACFDELSVLNHSSTEEIFKQLLSSQFIDVRLAWAREPRRYALRQGFCATTNNLKFIPDEPLSRRLWTIELNGNGRLDFDYLFANRFALWQEAIFLAQKPNVVSSLSFEEQKLVEANNQKYLK